MLHHLPAIEIKYRNKLYYGLPSILSKSTDYIRLSDGGQF